MYAVLLLSQNQLGLRQTVVCSTSNTTRTFTRVGMARGLGATWEELPNSLATVSAEPMLAQPITIPMSPAQVRDVDNNWVKPNNILQAARNAAASVYQLAPTGRTLWQDFDDVMNNIGSGLPVSAFSYQPVSAVASNTVVVEQPVTVAPPIDIVRDVTPEPTPAPVTSKASAERELATLSVPEPFEYVERKFDGISESEMYDKATANRWNVLLKGDAGTGKSSSARNLAARRQVPFVVVECTQQIDNTVTHGRFVPGADGKTLKWVYSQLATAIQQPSVILLNEFTRMNPKSSGLFLRLLEERELAIENFNEVLKVHPECQMIGDANMGSMYTGTTRSDAAFTDRFLVKLTFEYDANLEKKFLPYPALLNFATQVRNAADMGQLDFTVPLSTRLLKAFAAQVKVYNYEFAKARLLDTFPSDSGERAAIKTRLEADEPAIKAEFGI